MQNLLPGLHKAPAALMFTRLRCGNTYEAEAYTRSRWAENRNFGIYSKE